MTIFLILAPYATFALLMLVTSAAVSLFASAAICLAVIGLDVARGRSLKMLGAGSVIVFTAVGCYVTLVEPGVSASAVKLAVDIGIFLIALTSMLIAFAARNSAVYFTKWYPEYTRAKYATPATNALREI